MWDWHYQVLRAQSQVQFGLGYSCTISSFKSWCIWRCPYRCGFVSYQHLRHPIGIISLSPMAQQRTFCIPITAQTGYLYHIKIKNAAEVILCASQLILQLHSRPAHRFEINECGLLTPMALAHDSRSMPVPGMTFASFLFSVHQ